MTAFARPHRGLLFVLLATLLLQAPHPLRKLY